MAGHLQHGQSKIAPNNNSLRLTIKRPANKVPRSAGEIQDPRPRIQSQSGNEAAFPKAMHAGALEVVNQIVTPGNLGEKPPNMLRPLGALLIIAWHQNGERFAADGRICGQNSIFTELAVNRSRGNAQHGGGLLLVPIAGGHDGLDHAIFHFLQGSAQFEEQFLWEKWT